MNNEKVLAALSDVIDPDIKKDIVSLGMVSDVSVTDKKVSFRVTLTTPACPLKEKIRRDCEEAVLAAFGNDISVEITMDANVTSQRNQNINILPSVKNIICVASGKGGVGKSTVSVNLAMALVKQGAKVGLIDADIHGPSIPVMLGIRGKRPEVRLIKDKHYIVPLEVNGLKVLSIGLLVDDRQAIVWRGAMVSSALKQFVTDCIWGKLDYLIIDTPPGTGDVHLTMISTVNVTSAVIVTTPQEVAIADARKALSMFRLDTINVPVLGVVENMAYFSPPELPNNKYYLFGKEGGKRLAEEYEMPLLAQIPIEQSVREAGDAGLPVMMTDNTESLAYKAFEELGVNVARQIAIVNQQKLEAVSAA